MIRYNLGWQLQKRLWHRCSPVNFAKFLRTLVYKTPPGDCFWNFFNDSHMENCVLLNSVQEFIETQALADSDPFHMFAQSNNFYTFHCYILRKTDVWKIWFTQHFSKFKVKFEFLFVLTQENAFLSMLSMFPRYTYVFYFSIYHFS